MKLLQEGVVVNNRHRVKRLLGRGGMSTVYLVEDLKLPDRLWALKEMGENLPRELKETVSQQFRREAEILASLSRPRFPRVLDYFSLEGQAYLVMEYLQGTTMQKFINDSESFVSEGRIRKWGIELCDVLDYLHRQNLPVIFRDIKPDNIILGRSTEKSSVNLSTGAVKTEDNRSDIAKKRGAQPGHKGHGRIIPDLPEKEAVHEIPEDMNSCPICGKPVFDFGCTEDSYEIDYELRH